MAIDTTKLQSKINDFVLGKLQNKTASVSKPMYTSKDPWANNGVGVFVRNTDCWINGVSNISCIPSAQLSGFDWRQRCGVLITPRHLCFAKHWQVALIEGGTPFRFTNSNNVVYTRTLIQKQDFACTDFCIGLLDADVPSDIKIAKVLPKNWQNYLLYSGNVFSVATDQEKKALLKRWTSFLVTTGTCNGSTFTSRNNYMVDFANTSPYFDFCETPVNGDSSNPIFIIINNELVFLANWWTSISGASITNSYDNINSIIESLTPGGGYSLTDIDLKSAYENMPKRYFQDSGDNDWTNINNWWQDSNATVPAVKVPSGTDVPVLPWNKASQRVISGSSTLSFI